ncbi:heme ABC transporter ATP-binding protein [Rhodococcoides fascians A21d2]|uniref:heme ABC transporter ATP-binding protein n=1 Tax=Rhodococcoides fascians TaxID=1828 RepID=UPI00055DA935|nr:heme ABC transporter ATP-binding protein [Rhodococcus fascians]QII00247.1 heme ABC transporter ATP-binding protein [Rhodococcus fascians A21d2]
MTVLADSVSVDVAGRRILHNVSLTVGAGELVGVLGPNGSGKSTLLKCVYGALEPIAGTVEIDEVPVSDLRPADRARMLAVVAQENSLDFDVSVREVVEMGALSRRRRDTRADIERDIDRALDAVDVADLTDRSFPTLSGGEKQRSLIARALVQNCSTLVLDEPTNHLDIRHQLAALTIARRSGAAVLCALHDLNLAATFCDRVVLLDSGRVVATGTPTEVFTSATVARHYHVDAVTVQHPRHGHTQLLFHPPFDQETT